MSPVVITGAGAVLSKAVPWETRFPIVAADQINYGDIIGKRGLQYLSPATRMLLSASVFAWKSSGLESVEPARGGVVVGTNMCCMRHAAGYDWQALTEGVHTVSPMEGPNLLLNAPTARLGIFHKLMGFNTTLSSGRPGSLDAIEYAVHAIESGEVDVVITGAVESLSDEYVAWFKENGLIEAGEESVLTEGAGVLILESDEHAKERGARIWGTVRGLSSVFDPDVNQAKSPLSEESYLELWEQLSRETGITAQEVTHVHANMDCLGGRVEGEKALLNRLFPDANLLGLDSSLGELYTITGMIQAMYALETGGDGLHWIPNVDWFGRYHSILVEKRDA
ncbi:beta-ketoacyl synthase N-terminal-like domain-containing protein [Laceyella putida]|uniref:Beta-ketoacyl synthase N-terminal-like domain-containing protein n=1 Tax=Laceyella putida TaxID=110101 RepID=A0ABW2RHL7_9BACL